MLVVIDGVKYIMKWRHVRHNPPVELDGFPPYSGETICYIRKPEDKEVCLQVAALCSVKDNYDKDRGRKVSMFRILRALAPKGADNRNWRKKQGRLLLLQYQNRRLQTGGTVDDQVSGSVQEIIS